MHDVELRHDDVVLERARVAERWRTEMLDDPEAIVRFVSEFPEADPHRLRELAAAAQDEKRGHKPPKNYRELFHMLNTLLQDHARRHR